MLQINNFSLQFKEFSLLINQCLFPSEGITLLIGDNGSGKSSLLNSIAGLNSSYQGSILIDNIDILSMSRKEIVSHIAFLPQINTSMPSISGQEFIDQGLYISNSGQTDFLVNTLEIHALLSKNCAYMSGGEKQLLRFVRNITVPRPFILLDEPESFLSKSNRKKLADLIHVLSKQAQIIISTHYPELYHSEKTLKLEEIDDYCFEGSFS
ncbi:MAG: ATP-binding cassette domain-containing protein [Brevinemataceae bacterium]